jgi:hypothetical protein
MTNGSAIITGILQQLLFQRILNLLNTSIADTPPAPLQQSTISELEELKKIIDAAISG